MGKVECYKAPTIMDKIKNYFKGAKSMKKVFKIEDYSGKYVMHCPTKEESDRFIKYLDSAGRKWRSGHKYTERDYWDKYCENTCYYFNDNSYDDLAYYKRTGFTILEFSDFIWPEFTKSDLKDGMVVEYRNGDRFLVVRDHLLSKDYCVNMNDLGDDLKDIYGFQEDDIVKVYDADYTYVDEFEELFDTSNLKLLWEREKKPTHKYKVGDKVKVREDLIHCNRYGGVGFIAQMIPLRGKTITIKDVITTGSGLNVYNINESEWHWTDEMFEGLVDYEEMTVAEIEKKLGHKVKIVDGE
jgi:hypothetical protein